MLMFDVDVNQGLVLKTSTLSFREGRYLYTRCTFRFNTSPDVFIHLELHAISKIHNRATLKQ